jgi:hypothetical protein
MHVMRRISRRTSSAIAAIALAGSWALASASRLGAQGEALCGLLTNAEVQQWFPGSKPGQLDRGQEKQGVLTCTWDLPAGQLSILGNTTNNEAEESPKDEAKGMLDIFLDPLRADAARHVRYEVLTGVGDEAVAVVERQDAAKGFRISAEILVVRRGTRQVCVLSTGLARRERPEALRVLSQMGQAIASRLK